ncbi:MAG: hypothetical protein ABFS10_03790 [Bacteroidota bacterium]
MKYAALFIAIFFTVITGHAQTVENIQVAQDGDNLEITYRIGASSDAQIYTVFLYCSMDGRTRFEPIAVKGHVGKNIIGGEPYYTIVWDVFKDVDEVVNPEFFVRVELVSDASAAAAAATATRSQETVQEEPAQQEKTTTQSDPFEPAFEVEESDEAIGFERNGFFSLNFVRGFGIPLGVSFGSLNSVGYYVTPMRMGIYTYDYWDSYYGTYETDLEINYMVAAGITKHFISAGFYRLHGYWGAGGHLNARNMATDPSSHSHLMLDTGIVNVLGGFNLTLGISYSIGYVYPTNLVFGAGFVF